MSSAASLHWQHPRARNAADGISLLPNADMQLASMQGVFHVELKYTSRGPRLIEVNCRMGGGPVRDTNLRVWGVDLVEEHLLACLGIPTKPLVLPSPREHIAEYSVNAKKTGRIQNVDFCKVSCILSPGIVGKLM